PRERVGERPHQPPRPGVAVRDHDGRPPCRGVRAVHHFHRYSGHPDRLRLQPPPRGPEPVATHRHEQDACNETHTPEHGQHRTARSRAPRSAHAVVALRRKTWRYVCGDTLVTRWKCWRRFAAVPKPTRPAIRSTGSSLVSSNSCATRTRCCTSHVSGVTPSVSRNRRANVRGLMCATAANLSTVSRSPRLARAHSRAGARSQCGSYPTTGWANW